MISILLNSICLALTDYSDRDNERDHNKRLETLEMICSYIFILELTLKVIAMGFIMHPKSYLRDAWNWLDLIVVITGIIEIATVGDKGASFVRSLRVLRVLRPLKTI